MEYRQLGRSGMKVPALSLGTATFGGLAFFGNDGEQLRMTRLNGSWTCASSTASAFSIPRISILAACPSRCYGLARYVVYQGCYSLVSRHYEWELMPLALNQGLGTMVWSPLGWGRLTGKIRRGQSAGEGRIAAGGAVDGPPVDEGKLFAIVDVLEEIANERGKSIPQVALNWVLGRPSVANIVIGARNEQQLLQNLGALGWELAPEEVARLDAVSHAPPSIPTGTRRDSPNVIRSQPHGRAICGTARTTMLAVTRGLSIWHACQDGSLRLSVREIDYQPEEQTSWLPILSLRKKARRTSVNSTFT